MDARARWAGLGVAFGLIATMLAAGPAFAQGRHPYQLLSRNSAGGVPNAPAFDPAISQDGRVDRYAAYASSATDIVAGSGPHDNIFLVKRRRPWGHNGTPWRRGGTVLISRGLGGAPANGDSVGPSFSGDDHHAARCLAFVSDASNLVRGDRNGHADVFVKRLPNGGLHRIATPGPAQTVSVDGACRTLAFSANGVVYTHSALGGGRTRRVSAGRGAVNVDISVNGRFVVYDRNGYVYRDRHVIAAGQDPSADGFGRYVAFWLNGGIYRAKQTGAPHVTRVRQTGGGRASGASPWMTTGGSFIFYADGPFVRLNTYGTTMGECLGGQTVKQVQGSPHGNYDVFTCVGGAAYLDYIGGK